MKTKFTMNFKANITTKACTILILFAADQGTANTRAEFCSHPSFPQITSLAGFCVDTSAKKTWKRQGKNQAEIWKTGNYKSILFKAEFP